MPTLDPGERGPGPQVAGFSAGRFRIDDRVAPGAVILTAEAALDWAVSDLDAADIASLTPVLALDPPPEFLLLGTGPTLHRPPIALIAALEARGIGIEPMDSRAAARTWGVLRAEGRQIAAALLPI